MQFQFAQTEWLPPPVLRQRQMEQLAILLRHARATVPHYRELLRHFPLGISSSSVDEAAWLSIPIVEREHLQERFDEFRSENPPESHGAPNIYRSSGSSGRPVEVLGTKLMHRNWLAISLRDHLWHRRDFGGKLAAIRVRLERGCQENWGPWADGLITGPSSQLNIRDPIDIQLDWLCDENPDYLITYPSNLHALARRAIERRIRLPKLAHVRTFGEMLRADLRCMVRNAWSVGIADIYSAQEVGYIALQCPQHEHYHVQAESLFVEVLDEQGAPCKPGEIGSVVVTSLHNFAMPMLRYRLRDFAEVGEPCPCGRGLPVLKRIVGRARNMLVLPGGQLQWPHIPAASWAVAPPVRQFQVIQHTVDGLEVRLVCARPLLATEEDAVLAMVRQELGWPFQIKLTFIDQMEETPNGKYEDFVSKVAEARP